MFLSVCNYCRNRTGTGTWSYCALAGPRFWFLTIVRIVFSRQSVRCNSLGFSLKTGCSAWFSRHRFRAMWLGACAFIIARCTRGNITEAPFSFFFFLFFFLTFDINHMEQVPTSISICFIFSTETMKGRSFGSDTLPHPAPLLPSRRLSFSDPHRHSGTGGNLPSLCVCVCVRVCLSRHGPLFMSCAQSAG